MEITKHLKLTKDAPTEHYDVRRVNANSDKIDEFAEKTDTEIDDLKKRLGAIKPNVKDTDVTCTARNDKKLDVVLKELFAGDGKSIVRGVQVNDDGSIDVTVGDSKTTYNEIKTLFTEMAQVFQELQEKTNSIETELNGKVDRLERANKRITEGLKKLNELLG